jgi:hypothetical protein
MAKYQYRSQPFHLLLRLARYDLEDVDRLVSWSEQQRQAREELLERLTQSDEQFVDDVAEIDAFARLYAECAVVALWRCVELFHKRISTNVNGALAAGEKFNYKKHFLTSLKKLGIPESDLHYKKSVNEIRILNDAIKHDGYVGKELAKLDGWKRRSGKEFGDLRPHYVRLRPLAERYMDDLAKKATRHFAKRKLL